jgi:hypothetical protein
MPSISYRQWRTLRSRALDEIAGAHVAVGGSERGRRFATQQINRAYAVLLASQFQGFCRDLHSECVDHLLRVLAPPSSLLQILAADLTRGRHLDRGNAQSSSLGADFGRFSMSFWADMLGFKPSAAGWRRDLELLNEWRNAIVHEDFTSRSLSGIMILRLITVRRWRASCARLAHAMDEVMRRHMLLITAAPPW